MKTITKLNEIRQDNKPFIGIEKNVIYGTAVKQDYSKDNQDALYVNVKDGIFCLADGMGGEVSLLLYPEEMSKFIVSELAGLEPYRTRLHKAIDYLKENAHISADYFASHYVHANRKVERYLLAELFYALRDKSSLLEVYNQRAGATTLLAKRIDENTYTITKSGDTVFFVVDSNKNVKQVHGISTNYMTTGYIGSVDNGEFSLDIPELDEFTVTLEKGDTLVLSTDFIETEEAIKDFINTDFGRNIDFKEFQETHKSDDSTFISILAL
jgi:serine/threonine protein phosphatase PrpC